MPRSIGPLILIEISRTWVENEMQLMRETKKNVAPSFHTLYFPSFLSFTFVTSVVGIACIFRPPPSPFELTIRDTSVLTDAGFFRGIFGKVTTLSTPPIFNPGVHTRGDEYIFPIPGGSNFRRLFFFSLFSCLRARFDDGCSSELYTRDISRIRSFEEISKPVN